MSLFRVNDQQLKFHLVHLSKCEETEIRKMIIDNGGKVSNTGDPPIVNFTVLERYIEGRVMYDVQFIRDCVKSKVILDLHSYKLGKRSGYDGCIMSLFLYGESRCMYRCCNKFRNKSAQTSISFIENLRDSENDGSPVFNDAMALLEKQSLQANLTLPKLSTKSCNQGEGDTIEKEQSRLTSTEKRPCHVEYETEVLPKLIGLQKLCQNIKKRIYSPAKMIPHSSTKPQVNGYVTSENMCERSVDRQERNKNEHKERHGRSIKSEKDLTKNKEKCLACFAHNLKQTSKFNEVDLTNIISDSDTNMSDNSNHVSSRKKKRNVDNDDHAGNSLISNRYQINSDDSNSSIELIQCIPSVLKDKENKQHSDEKNCHDCKTAETFSPDTAKEKLLRNRQNRCSRKVQNEKVNRKENETLVRNLMYHKKFKSHQSTRPTNDTNENFENSDDTYSKGNKLRVVDCQCRNQTSKHGLHSRVNEPKSPSRETDISISRISDKNHDKINAKSKCLKITDDTSNRSKKVKSKSDESDYDDVDTKKVCRRDHRLNKMSSKIYITCPSTKIAKRKLPRVEGTDESDRDSEDHWYHIRKKYFGTPLKKKNRNNDDGDIKNARIEHSDSSSSVKSISTRKHVSNSIKEQPAACDEKLHHEKSKNDRVTDNVDLESDNSDTVSLTSIDQIQRRLNIRRDGKNSSESERESLDIVSGSSQSRSEKDKTESSKTCKTRNQEVNEKSKDTAKHNGDEFLPKRNTNKPDLLLTRRNFASWERRQMIRYLIDTDSIDIAKGLKIWKNMISEGFLTHRTPMSLHNHFLKHMLPNIDNFSIPQKLMFKFRRLK